jgi:hypothetical protein
VADGDVPGATGAGRDGDEAVWLDLVARFGAPEPADGDSPWPDREDLAGPVSVTPTMPETLPDGLPREPPTNPTGLPGLPVLGGLPGERPSGERPPGEHPSGERLPSQPWPGSASGSAGPRQHGKGQSGAGTGPRDAPISNDPADEHYVPPVPPPLPRLQAATRGAWLLLLSGPLYLLISTAVGATVSGFAAFLAVAAFVTGFVVIVLRMDNGRPPDSGSDDGAVV